MLFPPITSPLNDQSTQGDNSVNECWSQLWTRYCNLRLTLHFLSLSSVLGVRCNMLRPNMLDNWAEPTMTSIWYELVTMLQRNTANKTCFFFWHCSASMIQCKLLMHAAFIHDTWYAHLMVWSFFNRRREIGKWKVLKNFFTLCNCFTLTTAGLDQSWEYLLEYMWLLLCLLFAHHAIKVALPLWIMANSVA